MAEENTTTTTTPPSGTDPLSTGQENQQKNTAGNQSQENQSQTQEAQNSQMIPKHRFDEVNNELKELRKLRTEMEDKQKQADDERLKKQGEFEKLAQQREEELNQWKGKYNESLINSELRNVARELGAVDTSIVTTLIDKSGLEIQDDGSVRGAKEAVEKLLSDKPYLKGNGQTATVGNPSNPSGEQQQQRRFKASQLRDVKFFRENEADIMKAMRLGLIDDDTQ